MIRSILLNAATILLLAELLTSSVLAQAAGPRELLTAVGIDESVFEILQQADFDDPTSGDIAAIDHIATTLQRFDLIDVERWRQNWPNEVDVAALGTLFQLPINIELIEPRQTPAGGTIYRTVVQFNSDANTQPDSPRPSDGAVETSRSLIVWVKQIPRAWKDGINRPVRITSKCDALMINSDSPTLVTSRFSWLPQDTDSGVTAAAHQIDIAKLGVDVSRFEEIEHGKKVTSADRECFYQLLSRSSQIKSLRPPASNAASTTGDSFNIVELLQNPKGQTGRLLRLNGIARRAIRIPVNDQDIRTRFGIDHYYEIDVFVPMESILILRDDKTGENVRYDKYPMTFCVRQLPKGFPEGPVITQDVSMEAVYFKLWSYRNELFSQSTKNGLEASKTKRRQQSPLFIAHSPTIRILASQTTTPWKQVPQYFGLAFALAVALVAAVLYRNARLDDSLRRSRRTSDSVSINLPE